MTLTPLPDTIVGYVKSWTTLGEDKPHSKVFFWAESHLEDTGKTAFETFGAEGQKVKLEYDLQCYVEVRPVVIPANWEIV